MAKYDHLHQSQPEWSDNYIMISQALNYVSRNNLTTEARYGYASGLTGDTGTCNTAIIKSTTTGLAVQPSGNAIQVSPANSEVALMAAVDVAPTTIYFHATFNFMFYSGGIFSDPLCTSAINHAMVAVGYVWTGTSSTSYWIIRNSWATYWGEDGYIRVQMTGTPEGPCGMYQQSYQPPSTFVQVLSGAKLPPSPPPTSPSPLPPRPSPVKPSPPMPSPPTSTKPIPPSPPSSPSSVTISNPNFLNNATNWTMSGSSISVMPGGVIGGGNMVQMGARYPATSTLSQVVSGFVVGQRYSLGFFIKNNYTMSYCGLNISVGSNLLLSTYNIMIPFWALYNFSFTANTTNATVLFSAFHDTDFYYISNVNLFRDQSNNTLPISPAPAPPLPSPPLPPNVTISNSLFYNNAEGWTQISSGPYQIWTFGALPNPGYWLFMYAPQPSYSTIYQDLGPFIIGQNYVLSFTVTMQFDIPADTSSNLIVGLDMISLFKSMNTLHQSTPVVASFTAVSTTARLFFSVQGPNPYQIYNPTLQILAGPLYPTPPSPPSPFPQPPQANIPPPSPINYAPAPPFGQGPAAPSPPAYSPSTYPPPYPPVCNQICTWDCGSSSTPKSKAQSKLDPVSQTMTNHEDVLIVVCTFWQFIDKHILFIINYLK